MCCIYSKGNTMKDRTIKPISSYAYNRSTPLPDSAELRAMSIDAFRTLLRDEAKRMYPDNSRLMEFFDDEKIHEVIFDIDEEGNTLLHTIAWHNHHDFSAFTIIMFLRDPQKRNLIDAINHDGQTALQIALEQESKDVAKSLILQNADPDIGTTSALISALKSNLQEIAMSLIERGCNIHATEGSMKTTTLMWAIDKKMSDVAIELINRGVSVEQPNHNGETPLTLACKRDLSDVVKALLKAGANPAIKNRAGWLPFQLCRSYFEKRNPELKLRLVEIEQTFEEYSSQIAKRLESIWKETLNKN